MRDQDFIVAIVLYAIAFIVAIFVTRAIFSIPKFLKLQQAQLQIMTELARQQGVNNEIIKSIHDNCDVSLRVETTTEANERYRKARTPSDKALEDEALSHPKE